MTTRYEDQIDMLNAQMLDNDKKMIVMMLNEVKAILSLPFSTLTGRVAVSDSSDRDALVKLEKKLFNDLLSIHNIDKKELRLVS